MFMRRTEASAVPSQRDRENVVFSGGYRSREEPARAAAQPDRWTAGPAEPTRDLMDSDNEGAMSPHHGYGTQKEAVSPNGTLQSAQRRAPPGQSSTVTQSLLHFAERSSATLAIQ